MKEIWVSTENEAYSDIDPITESEYYRGESGNRYKLTSRRKSVSHHIYGHQICEMCDTPVNGGNIQYSGYVVCGFDCLNELVKRENRK
jgi:hypothetical protein